MKNAEKASAEKEGGAASFHVSKPEMDQLKAYVVRIMSEYNMKEDQGARLIIGGIFTLHSTHVFTGIKVYAPLLRHFSTVTELVCQQETFDEKALSAFLQREAKIQTRLLLVCSNALGNGEAPKERMAILCFLLFIEGIVKDTSLFDCLAMEQKLSSKGPAVTAQLLEGLRTVTDWLRVKDDEGAVKGQEEAVMAA
ncbi:uncharacterized protein LOC126767500 [Bactrocera neohumeralis]|uniref:uncharacterized protein LOC126767500 n=1 Tax=Bactrocera neohumeralis TaxID=98809 RepID=UPI002166849A|nr:uncharacterized protein LOC126767500 [Bactrocera neohumeralis]